MTKTSSAVKTCFALSLAIVLTACTTTLGRNFDEAYAQQIKSGETTKAAVRDRLGRPALRKASGDEETWTYAYYQGGGFLKWLNTDEDDLQYGSGKQIRLIVVFKGDVVRSSKFTREIPQQ